MHQLKTQCDSYIVCTSPRSGSTLLCKLLAGTGVAGNPDSYFHRPSVHAWCEDLAVVPDASIPQHELLTKAFRTAIDKGSLKTDRFGLRLQRHSFDFFTEQLAFLYAGYSNNVQRITAAFGRTSFIHLSREDKIEPAVSYLKTEKTGLWHIAPDGKELERLASPKNIFYDLDQIQTLFDEFTKYDYDWQSWFEAENIEPLHPSYESLSEDPIDTLQTVLDFLGLDHFSAIGVQPEVAKMADDINLSWSARFRLERNLD